MSNLVEYAKRELNLIGAFDKESDFYGGLIGESVLELIEVFSNQHHSGTSAQVVASLFFNLARFKNLTPLTFEDNEWVIIEDGPVETYQNKRLSSVFKIGKTGKPYYIDAHIQKNQNGVCWSGSLSIDKNKRIKRCFIKDPSNIPTVYIDVLDKEVNKYNEDIEEPGSGFWIHTIKDPSQLEELNKFYEVEIIENT